MMSSDVSFKDYLPALVEKIIDTMLENPQIPIFILQELSSNPERMPQIIKEMGIDPAKVMEKMGKSIAGPKMNFDPRQVILSMISLCIFPFAAKPVALDILYSGDEEAYISAMKDRKILIPMIINQIVSQNQSG
jgi:hypothetical protein